jgi:hypothetical protein
MPKEKVLDRALESALIQDASFRQWFIDKTRFQGIIPTCHWSRSDNPWCRVTLYLPNPHTGKAELVKRDGETDILFVFQAESGRRLALHIENKLASGRFTLYQPEVYEARAKLWVRNMDYGDYDEWETVLVAPSSFLKRNAASAQKFGVSIAHEDIAVYLPIFSANKDSARSLP